MAQVLMGFDHLGQVQRFDEDGDLLAGGNKIDSAVFVNFSRLLVKDEIKKGSFSITLGVSPYAPHNDDTSLAALGSDDERHVFNKRVKLADTNAQNDFRVNSPAGEYGILYASVDHGTSVLTGDPAAGSTTEAYLIIVNNTVRWNTGNVDRITSSASLQANTWTHIAVTRNSGLTRLFVGGSKEGVDYTDATNYGNMPVKIGANVAGSLPMTGHIENLMIKKGIAEYSSSFTPSATYDSGDLRLTFGFDGEAPIPLIKGEIYAIFQQTITSQCSADGVELWRDEIMTEEILSLIHI
mgnify:CR=1 FL=1